MLMFVDGEPADMLMLVPELIVPLFAILPEPAVIFRSPLLFIEPELERSFAKLCSELAFYCCCQKCQ